MTVSSVSRDVALDNAMRVLSSLELQLALSCCCAVQRGSDTMWLLSMSRLRGETLGCWDWSLWYVVCSVANANHAVNWVTFILLWNVTFPFSLWEVVFWLQEQMLWKWQKSSFNWDAFISASKTLAYTNEMLFHQYVQECFSCLCESNSVVY